MSVVEPDPDIATRETLIDSTASAFDRVRSAILNGDLKPGSSLSQVQLAAQLEVSRTPLREALRLLQHEGLIESDFNRRVRVAAISVDDLQELYAIRIALEPLAVKLSVPQLTEKDLDAIGESLDGIRAAAAARTFGSSLEPHRAFHFGLFSKVGPRMRTELENLWDHAERYRLLFQEAAEDRLPLLEIGMKEHDAIFEAARAGDAALSSRLIAEHLARTALTVIAQIDGSGDPMAVREALRFVLESAD